MLLKRYYFILYMCFVSEICLAQTSNNSPIDSLQKVLQTQTDTVRIKTLNKLAAELKNEGSYDKALSFVKESAALAEKINFRKGKTKAYAILGNIYQIKSNYPEALKYHFLALRMFEEVGDKRGISSSFNNIGTIFTYQKNYAEALKNFFASLKIKQEIGNKDGISYAYTNIGVVYSEQQNYAEALKYYILAMNLDLATGNKNAIASDYSNIAIVLDLQGKTNESLEKHKLALALREEIGDKYGITNSNINMGALYVSSKKIAEAKACLNKALAIAREMGAVNEIKYCYQSLVNVDSMEGNFVKAFADHKLLMLYRDSLFNEENTKKTLRIEMNYEFDKKQIEMEVLAKAEMEKLQLKADEDKKRQAIIIYSVIVGLLLVSVFSFFIFRSLQKNKKANKIIRAQKKEVEEQKELIEEKQKEVLDSIRYAKRIQTALITSEKYIEKNINRLTDKNKGQP